MKNLRKMIRDFQGQNENHPSNTNVRFSFHLGFDSIVCSYSKVTKVYSKILSMKRSENDFFCTYILPDYVSHESSKDFFKSSHS